MGAIIVTITIFRHNEFAHGETSPRSQNPSVLPVDDKIRFAQAV